MVRADTISYAKGDHMRGMERYSRKNFWKTFSLAYSPVSVCIVTDIEE